MEQIKEPLDVIPESRAARWAWRVSLIPLLGVPLFIVLAFLALYHIGSKGRTGFWLLKRGVIAIFLINIVSYLGIYFAGFSGYYPGVARAYSFLPKHGLYRTFYQNGQIRDFVYWRFGIENGKFTFWRDNGSKSLEGEHKNGLLEGKVTSWSEDGRKEETTYKDGTKHGTMTLWHENGLKRLEAELRNGQWNGKSTEWNEDGQICEESTYINGKQEGRETTWFWNGQKATETEYKNDKREGICKAWWSCGPKAYEEMYRNGQSEGLHYERGIYGDIEEEWLCVEGTPVRITYYSDGAPVRMTRIINGKWTEWHPNGQKRVEGNYVGNKRIGIWLYYDRSGNITEEELWEDGNKRSSGPYTGPKSAK